MTADRIQPRGVSTVGALALELEQDATSAWQDATPTVAKISNRPINLRRKSGMAKFRSVTDGAIYYSTWRLTLSRSSARSSSASGSNRVAGAIEKVRWRNSPSASTVYKAR